MPTGYNLQNALQFENSLMPLDHIIEEQEQEASSSSSSSEDDYNNVHEQLEELSSGLDEDDYEEVDEENEVDRYQFQYGFSLPGEEDLEQPIEIYSDDEDQRTSRPLQGMNWSLIDIQRSSKKDDENFRVTEDNEY